MKRWFSFKAIFFSVSLVFFVSCLSSHRYLSGSDGKRYIRQGAPAGSLLLGRAIIPAGEFVPGPTSGKYLGSEPVNNVRLPFVNKQPVQGISSIFNLGDGTFLAMADNGFGNAGNSGDFILAVYHLRPDFQSGEVEILEIVRLKDPNRKVNFPVKNNDHPHRYLTGADFDPESFQVAPDGTWWFGDEFGPFLLQTNSSGIVLQAPIMVPGVKAPENPFLREGEEHTLASSSGFEGMALSADGTTLYPVLERALIGEPANKRLILEFSLATNEFTGNRFYYPVDPEKMIGELVAVNTNQFLAIERDGEQGAAAVYKQIFLVDKSQIGPGSVVAKTRVADLMRVADPVKISRRIKKEGDIGLGRVFSFPFATVEAMAVIDSSTILVVNDNNFPFSLGRNPSLPDNTEFIKLGLSKELGIDLDNDNPVAPGQRNVIFIHPDGTSQAQFTAARLLRYGVNGMLNWDRMPDVAISRIHVNNSIQAGSVAGAVAHATGYRTDFENYGLDREGKPIETLMEKAQDEGFAIGLINSGSITEPGTGVFVAQVPDRLMNEEIAVQIIEQNADVVLGGGESWFLPVNVRGRHGMGRRTDGRNLVEEAINLGYAVVYNASELMAINTGTTTKLLGLFASGHTFNDKTESHLAAGGLPIFKDGTPTLAQMTEVAIQILSKNEKGFFLVIEEEGTDNFGNVNNAEGTIESTLRTDDAIGVALDFAGQKRNTLVVVASDSDAGGFAVQGGAREWYPRGEKLRERSPGEEGMPEGGPVDGVGGTMGIPFVTPEGFTFTIAWTTSDDCADNTIVRAYGLNAGLVKGTIDNVDIHHIMKETLGVD